MNRFLSILLILSLLLSFTACGGQDDEKSKKEKKEKTTVEEEIGGENTTEYVGNKKPGKPNRPNKNPDTSDASESPTAPADKPVQVPVTEGNSGNNGGNNGGNNAPVVQQNEIETNPLTVYQRAVAQIANNGIAGYNKKAWQKLEGNGLELSADSSLVSSLLSALKGTLTDLLEGFMTSEADASVYANAKGSQDAKNRMPLSNCSANSIQSVTVNKSGENYTVTIVMRTQVNPGKYDTDGITVMSRDILYMEDVRDTIKNDSTVSAVIKDMKSGNITYNSYTIKAVMTPDHKLVSIEHDCTADIESTIDAVGVGILYINGSISFHARYTDFVY